MSVLLVTYDLHKPDHHYSDLYSALRSYTHSHPLESVWVIDTRKTTETVRDELKRTMQDKEKDQLFVVNLRKDWGSWNMPSLAAWLKDNSRTWD